MRHCQMKILDRFSGLFELDRSDKGILHKLSIRS